MRKRGIRKKIKKKNLKILKNGGTIDLENVGMNQIIQNDNKDTNLKL
jgi:hypothetical protein